MTDETLDLLRQAVFAYIHDYVCRVEEPDPYLLKQVHTKRAARHAGFLARSLNLSGPDQNRAQAAALLHDIGRFPQFRRFGTFSDPLSKNHAALGVGVIVASGFLDQLEKWEKQLILRAVALHNQPGLPGGLPNKLDTQARLLRDADKMDIFKIMTDLYQGPGNGKSSFITHSHKDDTRVCPEMLGMLLRGESPLYDRVKSLNDMKLFQLSMIYDVNFAPALSYIRDHQVVDKILDSMPRAEGKKRLAAHFALYMDEKISDRMGRPVSSLPLDAGQRQLR
jgi:hypothetical protein